MKSGVARLSLKGSIKNCMERHRRDMCESSADPGGTGGQGDQGVPGGPEGLVGPEVQWGPRGS